MIKKDGFYFFDNSGREPIDLILGSVEAFNKREKKLLTSQEFNELICYIRTNCIKAISIFFGYPYDNIDFITDFPWIESISVSWPCLKKLDIINNLPNLKSANWEDPIPCVIDNPSLESLGFKKIKICHIVRTFLKFEYGKIMLVSFYRVRDCSGNVFCGVKKQMQFMERSGITLPKKNISSQKH